MNETNGKSGEQLFLGLMSGTSMDGIDAALIDCSTHNFIAGVTRPYSKEAKLSLNEVVSGENQSLKAISQLNRILGLEFAQAAIELLDKAQIPAERIKAIGSHGQTVCHDAYADIPYTLQLGCAHTIAEATRIKVVADFRTRDLVVGGQGAPFAPIYHQALFAHIEHPLILVNVGGVANVTCLMSGGHVYGYDLGPGNCLMDAWIKKHRGLDFDKNGDWARSGQVIMPLLDQLLSDPFFKKPFPKSIGKEYFSLEWINPFLQTNWANADVQATLLQLTSSIVVEAMTKEGIQAKEVLICGGGAHNLALLDSLSKLLPDTKVKSTSAYGIDPDFIEAAMFAWLAEKTLSNIALDLSQITGARRKAILGTIYPAGIDK
nr:anhydro-N-acetylmuramic acid kinase [Legionella jordanis]